MNRITGTAVGLFILGAAILFLPARGVAGPILKGEVVGTHVRCGGAVTNGGNLGRPQPLRVHGICRETLSIADTRVNITIIGDGGGDNRSPEDGGGFSACSDSRNTHIIGDDPTAAQIVQVRGRNITITGVEIHGVRADDPSTSTFPLSEEVWDPDMCPGGSDAQDPLCNNNRGLRAQRGGILLLGRMVSKGDFVKPEDPKHYIEQSGVCIHHTGKNGIEGQQSILRIVNSEIKNTGGDGINLSDLTSANIGSSSGSELNLPTDAFQAPGHAGPNRIHDNTGVGITVDRGSQARIVGNYIANNGAEGVRVRRHSHAELASSVINNNGTLAASAGVRVDDNSNISLGTVFNVDCFASSYGFLCPDTTASHTGTYIKQDTLANSVTIKGTQAFGIRCTVGGSISGKASTDRGAGALSLLKNGGAGTSTFGSAGATGTEDNCINKTN